MCDSIYQRSDYQPCRIAQVFVAVCDLSGYHTNLDLFELHVKFMSQLRYPTKLVDIAGSIEYLLGQHVLSMDL